MKKRATTYQILIHFSLLALCAVVLLLVQENAELRQDLVAAAPTLPTGPEPGATFSSLAVKQLDGQAKTLELADGKDRLVFFFTTTCPSCRENQSAWKAIHEQAQGDVDIVAISFDSVEDTAAYRQEHDLSFRVLVAEDPATAARELGVPAVPTTVRLGADGTVEASWVGVLSTEEIGAVSAG